MQTLLIFKRIFSILVKITITFLLLFAITYGVLSYIQYKATEEYEIVVAQMQKQYVAIPSKRNIDLHYMCINEIRLYPNTPYTMEDCNKIGYLYKEEGLITAPIKTPYLNLYNKIRSFLIETLG